MLKNATVALGTGARGSVEEEVGSAGTNIVFVKSDDQYTPRVVAVSSRQDGYCAIAGGIRPGEEIVVRNAYALKSRLYDELIKQAGVH